MELKHKIINSIVKHFPLLIVPYGIETEKWHSHQDNGTLLIVPYGIETNSGSFCK